MEELYKYGEVTAFKAGATVVYINQYGTVLLRQSYSDDETIKAWRPDIIATTQILASEVQYV